VTIRELGEVSARALASGCVGEVDPLGDPGHHIIEALTRPPERIERTGGSPGEIVLLIDQ